MTTLFPTSEAYTVSSNLFLAETNPARTNDVSLPLQPNDTDLAKSFADHMENSVCALVKVVAEREFSTLYPGFYKTRFDRLMKYAQGAERVEEAIRNLRPDYLGEVSTALHNSQWDHPAFCSSDAYSALICLYCSGRINEERFIHATQMVETLDHAGKIFPSKITSMPSSSVKFIDLNNPDDCNPKQLEKLQKEMPAELAKALAAMQTRGQRADCAVVEVTAEVMEAIRPGSSPNLDPAKLSSLQIELARIVNDYTSTEPNMIIFDEEQKSIYVPGFELWMEINRRYPFPITPTAITGTTSADDLATLRRQDLHPIILYNHHVENNFLRPHHTYHGALMGTLHDAYHCQRVSMIPDNHRTCFYDIDLAITKMNHFIQDVLTQRISFRNCFKQDFLEAHERIFGKKPGQPEVLLSTYMPPASGTTRNQFTTLRVADCRRVFLDLDLLYPNCTPQVGNDMQSRFGSAFVKMRKYMYCDDARQDALLDHYIFYHVAKNNPKNLPLLAQIPAALKCQSDHPSAAPETCYYLQKAAQFSEVLAYLTPKN